MAKIWTHGLALIAVLLFLFAARTAVGLSIDNQWLTEGINPADLLTLMQFAVAALGCIASVMWLLQRTIRWLLRGRPLHWSPRSKSSEKHIGLIRADSARIALLMIPPYSPIARCGSLGFPIDFGGADVTLSRQHKTRIRRLLEGAAETLEQSVLLVTGDPGGGKSTLLAELQHGVGEGYRKNAHRLLPVFIRIQEIDSEQIAQYANEDRLTPIPVALKRLVIDHLRSQNIQDDDYTAAVTALEAEWDCIDLLLLLDGIDEITDRIQYHQVQQHLRRIIESELASQRRVRRFVLTCRLDEYTGAFEGATRVHLQRLDSAAAKKLVSRKLQSMDRPLIETMLNLLGSGSVTPVHVFSRNPYFISLLIEFVRLKKMESRVDYGVVMRACIVESLGAARAEPTRTWTKATAYQLEAAASPVLELLAYNGLVTSLTPEAGAAALYREQVLDESLLVGLVASLPPEPVIELQVLAQSIKCSTLPRHVDYRTLLGSVKLQTHSNIESVIAAIEIGTHLNIIRVFRRPDDMFAIQFRQRRVTEYYAARRLVTNWNQLSPSLRFRPWIGPVLNLAAALDGEKAQVLHWMLDQVAREDPFSLVYRYGLDTATESLFFGEPSEEWARARNRATEQTLGSLTIMSMGDPSTITDNPQLVLEIITTRRWWWRRVDDVQGGAIPPEKRRDAELAQVPALQRLEKLAKLKELLPRGVHISERKQKWWRMYRANKVGISASSIFHADQAVAAGTSLSSTLLLWIDTLERPHEFFDTRRDCASWQEQVARVLAWVVILACESIRWCAGVSLWGGLGLILDSTLRWVGAFALPPSEFAIPAALALVYSIVHAFGLLVEYRRAPSTRASLVTAPVSVAIALIRLLSHALDKVPMTPSEIGRLMARVWRVLKAEAWNTIKFVFSSIVMILICGFIVISLFWAMGALAETVSEMVEGSDDRTASTPNSSTQPTADIPAPDCGTRTTEFYSSTWSREMSSSDLATAIDIFGTYCDLQVLKPRQVDLVEHPCGLMRTPVTPDITIAIPTAITAPPSSMREAILAKQQWGAVIEALEKIVVQGAAVPGARADSTCGCDDIGTAIARRSCEAETIRTLLKHARAMHNTNGDFVEEQMSFAGRVLIGVIVVFLVMLPLTLMFASAWRRRKVDSARKQLEEIDKVSSQEERFGALFRFIRDPELPERLRLNAVYRLTQDARYLVRKSEDLEALRATIAELATGGASVSDQTVGLALSEAEAAISSRIWHDLTSGE